MYLDGVVSNLGEQAAKQSLLKEACKNKNIHGIKVARQAPTISHLFFADDSLLFVRASETEASCIMNILKVYQEASGQVVNLDKSEASFSQNVLDDVKERIHNRMQVKTVMRHSKYLGLPIILGRSKKEIFSMVIDRVWKKIKGWKEKYLSRSGKEILIKAVAQAIPSYVMSCFRLPAGVCHEIESMLAKFWWGAKNGERKALDQLGEVGLFKGSWGHGVQSYAWRSILSARECVSKGARWLIGTGTKVRIWKDRWIPGISGFKPRRTTNLLEPNATVSELIDQDLSCWNYEVVNNCFDPTEANHILSIPLSFRRPSDELIWHSEKHGCYSVRSAYHSLQNELMNKKLGPSNAFACQLWKKVWHVSLHPRVKSFLWRLGKDILPTKTNLLKKGIKIDTACSFCGVNEESTKHLFLECEFSRLACFSSPLGFRITPETDIFDWLLECLEDPNTLSAQLMCTLLWKVWNARNLRHFQQQIKDPHLVPMAKNVRVPPQTEYACPDREVFTIQTDAGCFEDGFVTFGCMIKTGDSKLFYAACKKEAIQVDPATAEVLAIRWGLQLAKELHIGKILVQSDALNVVDCINCVRQFASIDLIAIDVRCLLSSFSLGSVMYLCRQQNTEAHNLVGLGRLFGDRSWLVEPPSVSSVLSSGDFSS
ncbi:uncharacterized protein LOC131651249 [Vicia villosa]|uniref:uncharacterized protein LOC131651249 n=1 Tax=Vicia villosa TaxID=3911 RepID=UPI00273B8F6C|nr:uncharacterized protein LOC131651249 [Vicia villosa]